MEIVNRIKLAWNAFVNNNPMYYPSGPGYGRRPDRVRPSGGRERSIIASIYNRIGVDCESMTFAHSIYDKDGNEVKLPDTTIKYIESKLIAHVPSYI